MELIISLYLDEVDTLDDVETELDVDTLEKKAENYPSIFLRLSKYFKKVFKR